MLSVDTSYIHVRVCLASTAFLVKPKRCPALDLDMGCGRYLQLPEESEQGTEVNVACGCGNQRSAVGPKLTCLPTGEWNVDTSVALCRSKKDFNLLTL